MVKLFKIVDTVLNYTAFQKKVFIQQGPVVQSVVSLMSSYKGHFVNCFSGFNIQYSDIFFFFFFFFIC